jgi:DNA-binding LacI/PurR family transcriptional regulator
MPLIYIMAMETKTTIANTKAGRVAATLAKEIETGRYSPGTFLPAERELAKSYRVSTMTMRKSLGILSQKGHLVKLPQRGVVVADPDRKESKIGQIAFIAPMLTVEAGQYIKGLTQTIDHERFSLATYTPHGDFTKYQIIIENVVRQRPMGIVIWVTPDNMYHVNDECFASGNIPVVTLGQEMLPHVPTDNVRDSIIDAAEKVARHILKKKCRTVAYFSTGTSKAGWEQVEFIRDELTRQGVDFPKDRIFTVFAPRGYTQPPDPYIDAQEYMTRLLDEGFRCDCVLCGHDYPAVGALRAMLARGIRVPQDMKVISLVNTAVEGATPLRLATVDIHQEQQARKAIQLLMRRIDGHAGPPEIHHISADLVEGETT